MPIVRQTSFAGGELSPEWHARAELDRYKIGAKSLLNYLVAPSGKAPNRPGSRLCEWETISDLVAVRLSSNGAVTSVAGTSWAAKTLPSTASRYAVGSNGYRFVTSGGTAAVWEVSDDRGATWTTKTKPDTNTMYRVFWDGGYFHAVGETGHIERSVDGGETWTTQTMSPGVSLTSITGGWFNSIYGLVSIGASGKFFRSVNRGVSWASGNLPRNATYNDIACNGAGMMIAVCSGYIARSVDNGATWTEQALTGNHTCAIYASGYWWIFDASTNVTYRSTDGKTWTAGTKPNTATPNNAVWTGTYVVVAYSTGFFYGPVDGSSWTAVAVSGDWRGVATLHDASETTHPRLVPFVFSDEQALVVEFRGGAIRFLEDGAYVEASGVPYAITSPYAESDLPRLKFAQMGNIITITHPSYSPRELVRTATSPLTFTLTAIAFDAPACPITYDDQDPIVVLGFHQSTVVTGPTKRWIWWFTCLCESLDGTRQWETAPYTGTIALWDYDVAAWSPSTTYGLGDRVSSLGTYVSLLPGNVGNPPATSPTFWALEAEYGNGVWGGGSTRPYDTDGLSLSEQEPVLWISGIAQPTTHNIVALCVYRGLSDVVGLVYQKKWWVWTGSLLLQVNDFGEIDPDYLTRPPKGENPFNVLDEDRVVLRTEDPATVAYQDERLIFGGTAERPNYLFMSRVGDWKNFDQYPIVKDDDSISVGLAGRRFEEIRSLLPGRSLLTFTAMSEWAVDGGQPDQPMTPTAISARIRSERGSTWLDALKVGDDHALFVQRKGTVVRDLAFDGAAGTYVNGDLSLFSHHLFVGKQVVDWCWQEDPWSIVWAILDDGSLVTLTFMPEYKVLAWSRHVLADVGVAESICSIPEGEEDAVYVIVRRGSIRSIERFATRQVTSATESIFLDSSVSYTFGTATTAITGLDHLEGRVVYAVADGLVQGPFTVASGAITLTTGALRVHVGLRYYADFESLDVPPGEGKTQRKVVKTAWVELEASAGRIQAGEDFTSAKLQTWSGNEADQVSAVSGLKTGQARIPTISHWNHGGRVCVRQSDPLPCTILAVTREVEYGQ